MADYVYRRPPDWRPKIDVGLFVILAAAGATSGVADISVTPTGALTGAGQLAGTCALTMSADAVGGGIGGNVLTGTADMSIGVGAATLTGSGALLGVAATTFGDNATASGANALQLMQRMPPRRFDIVPFPYEWWNNRVTIFPYAVNSATTGIASLAISADGTLRGAGQLVGNALETFGATAVIGGTGALAGSTALFEFTPTGAITGTASGAIAGALSFALDGSATLTGTAGAVGNSLIAFGGVGAIGSGRPILGTSAITMTLSGTISDQVPEPAAPPVDVRFSYGDNFSVVFSAP